MFIAGHFTDLLIQLGKVHRGALGLVFGGFPFSIDSFKKNCDECWWIGQSSLPPIDLHPLDLFSHAGLSPVAWWGKPAPHASLPPDDLVFPEVIRSWLLARYVSGKVDTSVVAVDMPSGECHPDAFGLVQNALVRGWLKAEDPDGIFARLRQRERKWEDAAARRLDAELEALQVCEQSSGAKGVRSATTEPAASMDEVCSESVDADALRSLIASVDHVTLDLFDTIFHRRVSRPWDVFWLLGLILAEETGLAPEDFANRREQTENELRREWQVAGRAEDVSFYPIYHRLAEMIDAEVGVAERWAMREAELEDRLLAVNPEFARWKDLLASKARLCLSEMYLPASTLAECLATKTGLRGIPVWTSGDTGMSKGSGRLYEQAEQHLGSPPDRLLHIGDNSSSDIEAPGRRGWKTFHWAAAQACRLDQPERWAPADAVSGVALGVIRADRNPDAPLAWQLGFELLGPVVWAWINHLARQPSVCDAEQVWLLARDGYWLEQVWKTLPESYRPAGEMRYVAASRQLWGMAAIEDISGTDWDFLLKAAPYLLNRDFFERAGMDVSTLREHPELPWDAPATDAVGFAAPEIRDRLYEVFVENIEAFHALRGPRRERVLAHLQSLNPDGRSVAMIDLGWHASSCENLSRLAGSLGWIPPRGHYFATWREARPAARAGARFSSFFTSMGDEPDRVLLLRESVALLENLFAGPHAGITDLTASGEPFHGLPDPRDARHLTALGDLWEGAKHFCATMGELVPSPVVTDGSLLAERALQRLLRYPQAAEAALFADWPHVEGWGLARSHPLIDRPDEDASEGQLKASRAASAWRRGWEVLNNHRPRDLTDK